jgi:hypothetical protein
MVRLEIPDSAKGQIISNSEIKNNFVKNIKDEIKKIFYDNDPSGNGVKREGDFIKTITSYIRRSKGASQKIESTKQIKAQESAIIKQFAKDNQKWIENFDESNYFEEGAEQKVYLSGKNVLKINDGIYYETWEDYLISLQIYNLLFPDTSYTLIGFLEKDRKIYAVVEQLFVKSTEEYNFDEIKSLLEANGFRNTKNQDFIHDDLGIILEDLHDENVLKQNGKYFIIDAAIFVKK